MSTESNAGERNEPTAEELKAEQIAKDMADGHLYMPQEMRDARDAKPERPKKPAKSLKDNNPNAGERIAKVLARAGLASRREIERLIGLGKIAVNGRILETPVVLVKATDVITVEGRVIGKAEATRLFRYHKPVGLVTTERDPEGRPTVFDKLPKDLPRVLKVGRLDLNSEGLLLLTNDGELARALELPSSGWVRRYRARALGHTTQARLDSLKDGTTVDGVIYGPIEATLDKMQEKADGRANVWITVAITEGKNREVRKVLESIGLKVNRLIRLAYGPFQLGNLEPGEVEEVGPRVIRELLSDLIPLKNLPAEGASQTAERPKSRFSRDKIDTSEGRPEGRRGGGDRFKSDKPKFGDKPRTGFKRDQAEKREFRPRDFDERPRFEGDGPSRDRKPYAPRAEGDFKKPYAKKSYAPRDDIPAGEAGAYERAKREFGGARADGDRPKRSYSDRPASDRPAFKKPYVPVDGGEGERRPYSRPRSDERSEGERPAYKKPYAAREAGERKSFDGPRRPRTDGDRSTGGYKKPYTPREGGEGERRPYSRPRSDDRPQGDRPAYKKPYAAREDSGERKSYDDRPKRSYGDKPQGAKPHDDKPAFKKSYAPRDGAGGGERKAYGDKPGYKREGEARGPKRDYAQREGAERKSYGNKPRPGGFKSGPRPGGAAGGKPYNRKPRGE